MVDFINEVEEELRKDDYNKFLKKYGPFLLGLIVAVILFAAYIEFSKSRTDRQARSISATYVNAVEMASDGNVDEAIRQFEGIAEQSPSGYAGLSYMRAASLKLDQNKPLEAIALFEKASTAFDKPRHSDLAMLKAAYLLAGQGRYDDARLRVKPLAVKDAPYEYLARELLALTLKQAGDVEAAKKEYAYLETIPGIPTSIQERAKQAMGLIRVSEDSAAELVNETAEDETAQTLVDSDEETENE